MNIYMKKLHLYGTKYMESVYMEQTMDYLYEEAPKSIYIKEITGATSHCTNCTRQYQEGEKQNQPV